MANLNNLSYSDRFKVFSTNNADFFKRPWKYNIAPFKIIGNVYYIGDQKVCIHLIDTGDGLVMIDTGYPTSKFLYLANIYELGFSPHDIKYIIHTHEHWDHWGATPDFVALFGCKTIMSKQGTAVLKERPQASMEECIEYGYASHEDLSIDITVDDGDVFELGNTRFEFRSTPGHAEGVVTIFFETEENGKRYRCALFGGATTITVYREHCQKYGISESIREEFLHSLEKMHGEKVDVVLGNHPNQNHTLEKRKQMIEHPGCNPFIDPEEWENFLDTTHAMVTEFLTVTDP